MKRWLLLWISFVSLTVLVPQAVYPCSFGPEPEDYRFAAFLPFLKYKPAFATFNYCYPLYADADNRAGIAADRERNIDEWITYLNNAIPREAIHQVLYATSPSDFEAMTRGERIMTAQRLAFNPFFRWLMMSEHRDAREYMRFAKYSEILSSLRDDPWEEDMIEDLKHEDFIPKWRTLAARINDPFIAERFSFQFLRLHFYFKDFDSVIAEYERSFASKQSHSVIQPWAEEYYAVSLADDIMANYHLAQSFGACDDKKLVCVMEFDRSLLNETLELAKTNTERFNIHALWATNDPERHLETLEKLYKLDPKNALLEMLAAREVNKLEDWLLTPAVTGNPPAVRIHPEDDHFDWGNYEAAIKAMNARTMAEDKAYARQVAAFLNRVANEGRTSNITFWLLASAYSNFVAGDNGGARSMLAQYRQQRSNPFTHSADALDLMIRANEGKFDAAFERDLLAYDTSLSVPRKHEYNYEVPHRIVDQLLIYIAYEYDRHGDFPRYAFVMSNAEGWWWLPSIIEARAEAKDVPKFLSLVTKKDKTDYEEFLTRQYPKDSSEYYRLLSQLGSTYLRSYRFKDAYDVFSLVPDSIWTDPTWANSYITYLNQNPFVARAGSNHLTKPADTVTYTKKSFTARMLELERLIADPKTPNRDELFRQYADAHFAMTFYGNSWLLVHSGWSYTEIDQYNIDNLQDELTEDIKNYYGCRKARTVYETLYNSTRDPEIKAHCAFMISRCDRSYAYILSKDPENFKYKGDKFLNQFLTEFKNTKTAKAIIDECPSRESFTYWTKRVIE